MTTPWGSAATGKYPPPQPPPGQRQSPEQGGSTYPPPGHPGYMGGPPMPGQPPMMNAPYAYPQATVPYPPPAMSQYGAYPPGMGQGMPQQMMAPHGAPLGYYPPSMGSAPEAEQLSADAMTPDQLRTRIEASLGSAQKTTAYVGSIADGITDELLTSIFTACGPVKKWKRLLDVNGQPKSFGFLECAGAEGLLRVLRLLPEIVLLGKAINIKIDDPTREYLKRYQEAIKNYEETNANAPNMSATLEDDLRSLDEINMLLKARNLASGMQHIEDKVRELTMGPVEKPAIVLEQPKTQAKKDAGEEERPKAEPARLALTGWETPGYREREKRWLKREQELERTRSVEQTREAERTGKIEEERMRMINFLDSFDDSPYLLLALEHLTVSDRAVERKLASYNVTPFYMERDRWRERRRRELGRQLEQDSRETQKEAEASTDWPEYAPDARGKRDITHVNGGRSKRARQPLISQEVSLEELLASGHDIELAKARLQEQCKEQKRKLVTLIPAELEALFGWDLDWDLVDINKVGTWLQKHIAELPGHHDQAATTQWIEQMLLKQTSPKAILEGLGQSVPKDEAEVFVMRLWRYLVYESEAIAYNLNA